MDLRDVVHVLLGGRCCDLHPPWLRHGRRCAVPVLSAGDGTQWRLPAQSVNHTPMTAKCMVMATGDPYLADQRKRESHVMRL